MSSLASLLAEREVIVCCGSGGVGKTTTAAALGWEAASRGMRVCVVTIDPAKRLADALGLASLGNHPRQVSGTWPGELWALMLDTKATFDELVVRYAADADQAAAILANPIYRNLASALSGTQEYMAAEKLYELHREGREGRAGDETPGRPFDVVIVDTPPTRNALDFLDAPRRLTAFLDNRVFRLLMTPTRAYLRAVGTAAQAMLKTIGKVVGHQVVDDVVAFFTAFEGMEEGFRARAQSVRELLADDRTAFVLVTTPRPDAVAEARFFADRLRASDLDVDALVVNRIHPRISGSVDLLPRVIDGEVLGREGGGLDDAPDAEVLAAFRTNLADFQLLAEREERRITMLAGTVGSSSVVRVPDLDTDVHDLEGLSAVADALFGRQVPNDPPAGSTRRG